MELSVFTMEISRHIKINGDSKSLFDLCRNDRPVNETKITTATATKMAQEMVTAMMEASSTKPNKQMDLRMVAVSTPPGWKMKKRSCALAAREPINAIHPRV